VICRLRRRWDRPYWRPRRYWKSDSTLRFRTDTNLFSDESSGKSSDESFDESFDETTFKELEFEDIDSYLASL
jgi:hypothetical protein